MCGLNLATINLCDQLNLTIYPVLVPVEFFENQTLHVIIRNLNLTC